MSELIHAIFAIVYYCGCSIQLLVTDSILFVPTLQIKLYPGFSCRIEMWSIPTVLDKRRHCVGTLVEA